MKCYVDMVNTEPFLISAVALSAKSFKIQVSVVFPSLCEKGRQEGLKSENCPAAR